MCPPKDGRYGRHISGTMCPTQRRPSGRHSWTPTCPAEAGRSPGVAPNPRAGWCDGTKAASTTSVGGRMYARMGRAQRQTPAVVALVVVSACILLARCPCASALDPSLDISQYAHTAWKIREGFTRGEISSIAQTPDGYLWLGTEFGLLRFDGVRTVPWQPPPAQHLPSSRIFSLLAARDGTLWIGTSKGLTSWKGGKLTQYAEPLDRRFVRKSSRITKARYGPAGLRPPAGSARFTKAGSSATERTALSVRE
jgi:hypothetical protein